jgi:ferric-dicitrate binding protein FerR (iron transport regulator)
MTQHRNDYLWDPTSDPDAEISKLERLLGSQGAAALGLADRDLPIHPFSSAHRSRRWRRWGIAALTAAAAVAVAVTLHFYRLGWMSDAPWPAIVTNDRGLSQAVLLQVGNRIATAKGETATVEVARIGTVSLAENSVLKLVRTQKDRHRVELEHGRLRARIWAPPRYFGVGSGGATAVDLGCEFEIASSAGGPGTLTVTSGWVMYVRDDSEILVPEGHSTTFDGVTVSTPVRVAAELSFRELVGQLDSQFAQDAPDGARAEGLAERIASAAGPEDYFTLLSLLSRHPELARTSLYSSLAAALAAPVDETHRARWLRNDVDAKNEWWNRLPKQPKRWWLNWRDAL